MGKNIVLWIKEVVESNLRKIFDFPFIRCYLLLGTLITVNLIIVHSHGYLFKQDVMSYVVEVSTEVYIQYQMFSKVISLPALLTASCAALFGLYPYEQSQKSASKIGSSICLTAP